MKTFQPKAKEVKREWHLVDAKGKVLGRISTQIARFLIGKHKPSYSTHMDSGDYVVVVNAKDIILTGKKTLQKVYKSHSGYPGGFKEISFEKMIATDPTQVVKRAVKGMLPSNRLLKDRLLRLKIFIDSNNPYKDKFGKDNL